MRDLIEADFLDSTVGQSAPQLALHPTSDSQYTPTRHYVPELMPF
jgi:hypothetical protein